MSQRPEGRTITQRLLNSVRGLTQSQNVKDAKLLKYVNEGNYERVLEYLGRGARVTEDTLRDLIERIRAISNTHTPLNRDLGEIYNDIQIFKVLTNKYKATDYSSMISVAEEGLRFRQQERGRIAREEREARYAAAEAEGAREGAARRALQEAASAAAQLRLEEEHARWEEAERVRREAERQQAAANNARRREREVERARARAAAWAAEPRYAAAPPAAAGHNDAYEVHREMAKFKDKVPAMLEVIKRDLGNPPDTKYKDIEAIIDETLGKYIRESPDFESKAINSIQVNKPNGTKGPKILSRAEWISDLERIKKGLVGATIDKRIEMGMIFDFIIKHKELTECFIAPFVHDCTHAYSNGRLSCFLGITERTVSSLLDCININEMDEGVFGEINEIMQPNIWEGLSEDKRRAFNAQWGSFLRRWAEENRDKLKLTAWPDIITRFKTAYEDEYSRTNPAFVMEYWRNKNSDEIKDSLEMEGIDPEAKGGRRRKTRRHRTLKRTRRR